MSRNQVKQGALLPFDALTKAFDAQEARLQQEGAQVHAALKNVVQTKPKVAMAGAASLQQILKKDMAPTSCSEGFSRSYDGPHCAGDDAWFQVNNNRACECTDGVCNLCCREETTATGDWSCSWEDPGTVTSHEFVADDACNEGYSRTYGGTYCVGDDDWFAENDNRACECTDGA